MIGSTGHVEALPPLLKIRIGPMVIDAALFANVRIAFVQPLRQIIK